SIAAKDFCYWNDTDARPKGVSFGDWESRGIMWQMIDERWNQRIVHVVTDVAGGVGFLEVCRVMLSGFMKEKQVRQELDRLKPLYLTARYANPQQVKQ
ncbi:MAG: hypothetical protein ACRC7O_15390, partial [Fimbriiglobus sp.]